MARVLLVSALFLAVYVSIASAGALGGLSLDYFLVLHFMTVLKFF